MDHPAVEHGRGAEAGRGASEERAEPLEEALVGESAAEGARAVDTPLAVREPRAPAGEPVGEERGAAAGRLEDDPADAAGEALDVGPAHGSPPPPSRRSAGSASGSSLFRAATRGSRPS